MRFIIVRSSPSNVFSIFSFFGLLLLSLAPVLSGLDEFTKLRVYEGWLIERKINGSTNKVLCRASIPDSGIWFAARIRINYQGTLLIPSDIDNEKEIGIDELEKVRAILEECQNGFVYLPKDY